MTKKYDTTYANFMTQYDTNKVNVTKKEADEEFTRLHNFLSELKSLEGMSLTDLLKSENIPIDKTRAHNIGSKTGFNQIEDKDLIDSYMKNKSGDGRRGINITNDYNIVYMEKLAPEIKKINNIVNTLTSMAQNLASHKYSGASHQNIIDIKDIYEDLADKMYIFTGGATTIQQFVKLKNDFNKLYQLVKSGLSNYTPITGGQISRNKIHLNFNHPKFQHLI